MLVAPEYLEGSTEGRSNFSYKVAWSAGMKAEGLAREALELSKPNSTIREKLLQLIVLYDFDKVKARPKPKVLSLGVKAQAVHLKEKEGKNFYFLDFLNKVITTQDSI
jgi:hypothetical protein